MVSHGGLGQSLASRTLTMLPFSFPPGITEGDPTYERVKSEIPSRACKTLFPPLASSPSVVSLEFLTVCCQHPPPAPPRCSGFILSAFTHAVPSVRDLAPILSPDEQIQSPFWYHSSRKTSLSPISPPPPLPSLYSSTSYEYSLSHHSKHSTCLYLPLIVAPSGQGMCLIHLCLPSSLHRA